MHVLADLRRVLMPGSSRFLCTIAILGSLMLSKAEIHQPVIGEVYSIAENAGILTQPAATGKDTVSIQSATGATPGPICEEDSQCRALCPAVDFAKAQPSITIEAVQQQVRPSTCSQTSRTSKP